MKNNLALKGKCGLSLLLGLGLSLCLWVSLAQAQCPNDLCYVDADVMTSTIDGMSWRTAYTNLQDALAVATAGDEIWVAAGVYYPDEGGGQTNDDFRASFALTDGVKIYGGFAGTETERSQRQPRTNVTVLSGDIDGDDITDGQGVVTATANIRGLNAYHVIYNSGVSSTAVLDGFTITAGHADVGSFGCPDGCGGGMYNFGSSPVINQISFSGNRADSGGGMFNNSSSPVMSQVSFSGNSAALNGGGMFNFGSRPEMSQVSFSANRADRGGGMFNNNSSNPEMSQVSFSGNRADRGGGMFNNSSSPVMSQVSFSGNSADEDGGGMFNDTGSQPQIINSIFWQNEAHGLTNAPAQILNISASTPTISYTLIQRSGGSSAWESSLGMNGGHNLDADPLFREPIDPVQAPTSAGNLRLRPGSPAIDVGDDRAASGPVDLDGAPRIQGGRVDLGAYEIGPIVSLSKAVSPVRVEPDQRVTYTLVLSNSGVVSDSVRLSDTLPSGVEFAAWVAQGGAVMTANEISWQGPVTVGESISITFVVTNLNLSGAITNRAQFSGSLQTGSSRVSYTVFRRRLYVDAGVTLTMPDGLRWTLAFTNLQDALAEAVYGDEIWVAAGVYYPDEGRGQTNDNALASFAMKDGVEIYGGFAGTETERSQRQPRVNVTVLSGDIDRNDGTDSNGVVTATTNITGMNAHHVIRNSDVNSTAVLDGFTITAGYVNAGGLCPNNCGGGMLNIRSSPQINQISFSGHHADANGGGMLNWDNSHPKMSQISFSGNTANGNGGGMFNSHSSHPKMSQVSFSGNRSHLGLGGGMFNSHSSHPEMSQVSFSGNSAKNDGGGMYNFNSSPHIVNSIFWGNAANGLINARAQISNNNMSSPVISYTLIQRSGGSSAWDNNLGSNGGHNLDADPLFREPIDPADFPTSAGNLRLRPGSPAIDAGDDRAASGPQDLDGALRIQGAGVDLGAYETPAPYLSLSKAVSPALVEPDQRVTYTLLLSNSGLGSDTVRLSDPLPSGVEFAAWVAQQGAMENANEISWQGPVTAGESISITFAVTNRSLSGAITNRAQFSGSLQTGSSSVSYTVFKRRLYVDAAGMSLVPDGLRWTLAFTNLQDALAEAADGDEIWVAAGVYYPDEGGGQTNNDVRASFALKNGVKIYGGFAGTETERSQRQPRVNVTVLSGDIDGDDGTDSNGVVTATTNITGANAYHVIYNIGVSSTAVLDGFTITAGDVNAGSLCADNNNCGGGMLNIRSSPQLTQISFRGNRASAHGGGMVNWENSHPKMSQVSFSGNRAAHGGGMFNSHSSHPKMSQVSFSGNFAFNGGGMFNQNNSHPEMSQVSFSGNSAQNDGGGMFNVNSSPQISNSIFWGNAANGLINASAQITNTDSSTPTISYTLIQSSGGSSAWESSLGTDGGHNLDADPRFREPIDPADAPTSAGNLRLRRGSPAIDAGDDRAASGPQDLDGAPRIQGRRVDLGAYETGVTLSLSKAVSPVRVEPGQRVTYTLVLNNSGLGSDSVRLSDTLPSGVEFAAWVAQGGGVITANEISWQGPVTAGESISITFVVSNLNLSGAIINRAQFSGSLQTGSTRASYSVLNVPPLAADDTYSTDEDTPLTIAAAAGVLSNDGDRNGDSLAASVQSDVSQGTLDLQVDGSFVYTPQAHFNGQDYFSYQVSDGVLTDTASVTVTIEAVNDAPLAVAGADQSVRVSQSVTLDGSLSSDVEGDALRYGWQQTGGVSVTLNTPSLSRTTFTAPATSTVLTFRLSVTDEAGVSSADEVVITATEEAIAGLSVQNTSPSAVQERVTFTASITAGTNVSYTWDFGDGEQTSGKSEVSHVYTQVETYTATVVASNSINTMTATTRVTITTEEAIAGLSVQNSPVTLNEVVTFTAHITAGDNVTYTWQFGDGGSAVGQIVPHVYTQAGTYIATVVASNSINILTATTVVSITPIIERPEIDVTDYLSPVLRFRHFTAYQGVAYSYTVKVSPSLMRTQTPHLLETQIYTLSALHKPAWLDFVEHGDNTGTLMGVPGAADRGEQAVTILATDGQVSSTAVFTLTVGPNQVYLPLVLQ